MYTFLANDSAIIRPGREKNDNNCISGEEIEMRSIKLVACSLILAVMCSIFAGCSKVSPEGHWILIKKIHSNGVVYNAQDLSDHRISEEIDIVGNVATYKSYADGYAKLSCVMSVDELYDNNFSLNMPGTTSYMIARVDGNELTYYVDDALGTNQMIFRRG